MDGVYPALLGVKEGQQTTPTYIRNRVVPRALYSVIRRGCTRASSFEVFWLKLEATRNLGMRT